MTLPRRKFMHLAAGAVALPAVSTFAWAQTYPSRPVRIIVGFAPGSSADIIARLMSQSLSERLGQQFIIDNRPGVGGNIATEAVVQAEPDGHTLVMVGPSNAINATLYEKLGFDFIRDIVPVAAIARSPNVMLVNQSVSATTVPEFVALAKANPGQISMASAGVGTASHLAGELFQMMTGAEMVHAPYRGGAGAYSDLLGGGVDVYFPSLASSIEHIKAGRLRRPGGDHRVALGPAAEHPDHGRIGAGLRGKHLVRRGRAQEHARRDRRQAQQGDQCELRRSEG